MIPALKNLLHGDSHQVEVLRGAAVAFLLRAIGAVLALALNVFIGRVLGPEGAGLYFLSLSIVTIVAVIARFGLDNSLLRFISSAASQNQWARVNGVYRLGMRAAAAATLTAGALISLLGPFLAETIFGQSDLGPVLRVMGFGTFGLALMFLGAETLKGLKKIAPAVAVSSIIFPIIAIALVWPLSQRFGPSGAAGAYVIGVTFAAFAGILLWRRFTTGYPSSAVFDRSELWGSCRPLWTTAVISNAVLPWSPMLILGIFAPADDVGIYGAATRIVMLVTFLLTAVNTVISPKFAELYAIGELKALGKLSRRFAMLITVATSPVILALTIGGDLVMSLFGPEFVRGGSALAILAAGQAVNALTGSSGALLMMTGHERDIRRASIAAGALAISLSLILIPFYSLIGAAIAMASSVAVMNLISIILIKNRLGIMILPWVRGG